MYTNIKINQKLAASYIVFDDVIEHLESSISTIRNNVDYISIVYQHISYYGNKGRNSNYELLENLLNRRLIDNIIYNDCDLNLSPKENEIKNRNLGLNDAINNQFEFFMSVDGDEYYDEHQFKNAKNKIINCEYESSACELLTYYKYLNLVLDPPEDFHCPFIYKINKNFSFGNNIQFPVGVDITRIYHSNKFKKFERNELIMHHMSSVRRDFKLKLVNHGCYCQFNNEIEMLVDHYDNYQYPNKILFQANPYKFYDPKIVNPYFINENFNYIQKDNRTNA